MAPPSVSLQKQTNLRARNCARTVLICDIGLDSLTLPPPEAGDFLELICIGTCCPLMEPSKIETLQNRLQGSIQKTITFYMSVRLSVCMRTTGLEQERFFVKLHTHTQIYVYISVCVCVCGCEVGY